MKLKTADLIPIREAIGKTLSKVIAATCDNAWILVFQDGSKCHVSIDKSWDGDEWSLEDGDPIDVDEFRSEDIVEAGILPQSWYDEKYRKLAEQRDAMQRARESDEREQYERLKKKFEGENGA